MRHQTKRNSISDEQVDKLLYESMVETPKKIEQALAASDKEKAEVDAYFDEQRKAALKERIDLEREKRMFEEKKAAYARSRRIKIGVAVAACLAVVIAVPMTSQSARKFLDNLGLHIFSDVDTVMTIDDDKAAENFYDETEAWEKAKEVIGAERMYFEGVGDEWLFRKAEYYGNNKTLTFRYYYNGNYVVIETRQIKNGKKGQDLVDGELMDEYKYDGNDDSYVRLYGIENTQGRQDGYAEIVYNHTLYLVDSEVPYEDFEKLVKGISFQSN